jgi:hypothetical protein
MSHRRLLVLALLSGLPTIASAQFTTFIPPRNKAADSAKTAVVEQQRAKADSIVKVQLTNMKTWVDSAAGVVAPPSTAADSMASMAASMATLPSPAARDTQMFARAAVADSAPRLRNGERAPATASDLPLLALIGAIALGIGTVMLAGNQLGRDRA